jgi:hypothetical protein
MSKLIKGLGVLSLMVAPFMSFAQTNVQGTTVQGTTIFNILVTIGAILNIIIPILITLAVIYVIYGVIKYVTASDSDGQAEGRTVIISGIVGLFVIVSIWGLVAILNSTFGVNQGGPNIQDPGACAPIGFDPVNNTPIFPVGC